MDSTVFWDVIGTYNSQTKFFQIIILNFILVGLALSYTRKVKWAAKLVLGLSNLFIGIAFFGVFGTEPIQKYFALPLYLICGSLFLTECFKNKNDTLNSPNKLQLFLIALCALYPVVSFALGNQFPKMVTYIMPCPIISLSIAIYSGYQKKNKVLLLLLTVWGLTGIKSLIFSAYEDMILLLCGMYGIYLIWAANKNEKPNILMH